MTSNAAIGQISNLRPKYLWLLLMTYTIVLFASNCFDPRHIKILGLCTGAGSIAFPLTYLLADIITEVYGYKNARVAILSGLLFLAVFVLYGQFVLYFLNPTSSFQAPLSKFLSIDKYIIFASIVSYLATESINSYLVAKLKIIFKGQYMGLRFIAATIMAYIVDELTYAPIAFHSLIHNLSDLTHHIIDSWIFMFSIEIILLPLSIRLAKAMKRIEGSDIYDTNTKFSLFSLEDRYKVADNHYKIS